MAEKKVKITFEVDGVQQTVNSVEELNKALKDTKNEAKDVSEEGSALGLLKGKFAGIIGPLKGVVAGMKTLRGAIISTGVGALVVALGSLVAYFTSTEEGSKKLKIATEALSILWGKFTEQVSKLGEAIVYVFENPKQAIIDFKDLLVANIMERVQSLIDMFGYLGSAVMKVFQGDFKGALADVKEAGSEFVDTLTGVDNTVEKVAETSVRVFKEVKAAVQEAVATAEKMVDAQRALRDQQQALVVQNAELNKELETQQKIAEDTTLSYDERKAALERVGEAQVRLAENVAAQAANEEALLRLQIQNANSYEEREELETQLADATAARIEAETALEIQRQDAAKITRELELEELERKRSINDILAQLDLESIENQFEKARQELAIQEEAALNELNLLRATEEQKQAIRDGFQKKREKLAQEEAKFNKDLDQQEANTKLAVAAGAFDAISQIAGEQSAIGKAAAVASATINTYQAATNALANTPAPPPFPQIAAAITVASGLLNVKKILSTPVPGGRGGGGGVPAPQISAPTAPAFDPNAALEAAAEGQDTGAVVGPGGRPEPIKAYVIASDVTSSQEANKKIEDLATL